MPKEIDDMIRQRIKKDLAGRNGTKQEIADRHGVSIGTVKRLAKEIKPVTSVVEASTAAIAKAIVSGAAVDERDYAGALGDIIDRLQTAIATAEAKSLEGTARALMEALDKHREYMTMERAIEWLVDLPDFDPARFTKLLKDKYGAKQRRAG